MSEQITAVVDPITSMFCEDGMAIGRIIVNVPNNPDSVNQRYSGDPINPIRIATPAEISASLAIVINNNAALQIDSAKALRAAIICNAALLLITIAKLADI